MIEAEQAPFYLYPYVCHEEERELCGLELRTLFGCEPKGRYVASNRAVDPSRSPFVKGRMHVQYRADSLEELAEQAAELKLEGETFKVRFLAAELDADYDEQRRIERIVGSRIRGKADMRAPDRLFAIAHSTSRWLLGSYTESEAVWLRHKDKPQQYSTALSTKVARAVANVAVPDPDSMAAIDPCCGIGTVLIEALSMGIAIRGADLNPLAVAGARRNLAHFGMRDVVQLADMRTLEGRYDAVILDLPYNLCSRLDEAERLDMLRSARRLGGRAVIVTTEQIDAAIRQAGWTVRDRCVIRKGAFERQVIVCI